MKKIFSLALGLVVLLILIWLFFIKGGETTLQEEFGKEIDSLKVNEIEVVRGSDEKTVEFKDGQTEKILDMLLNAELKEAKTSDGEATESYWISIRENDERTLGIRIDNSLVLTPHSYKGSKKKSGDYLLKDDSVLNFIESLFE